MRIRLLAAAALPLLLGLLAAGASEPDPEDVALWRAARSAPAYLNGEPLPPQGWREHADLVERYADNPDHPARALLAATIRERDILRDREAVLSDERKGPLDRVPFGWRIARRRAILAALPDADAALRARLAADPAGALPDADAAARDRQRARGVIRRELALRDLAAAAQVARMRRDAAGVRPLPDDARFHFDATEDEVGLARAAPGGPHVAVAPRLLRAAFAGPRPLAHVLLVARAEPGPDAPGPDAVPRASLLYLDRLDPGDIVYLSLLAPGDAGAAPRRASVSVHADEGVLLDRPVEAGAPAPPVGPDFARVPIGGRLELTLRDPGAAFPTCLPVGRSFRMLGGTAAVAADAPLRAVARGPDAYAAYGPARAVGRGLVLVPASAVARADEFDEHGAPLVVPPAAPDRPAPSPPPAPDARPAAPAPFRKLDAPLPLRLKPPARGAPHRLALCVYVGGLPRPLDRLVTLQVDPRLSFHAVYESDAAYIAQFRSYDPPRTGLVLVPKALAQPPAP
jgi:hypothetical protein